MALLSDVSRLNARIRGQTPFYSVLLNSGWNSKTVLDHEAQRKAKREKHRWSVELGNFSFKNN